MEPKLKPYYVVASGWELRRRGSGQNPVRNENCACERCIRDPGGYKKIVVKTSWMRVALVKTKIDPEDTPKEQDHLKGQAQRQMLDTSSLSHSD